MHWDASAGHGDGLAGASRDRVVMFTGTGSTRGWQGWLARGRRRHSSGADEWRERRQAERSWSSGQSTAAGEGGNESDQTCVNERKKDL